MGSFLRDRILWPVFAVSGSVALQACNPPATSFLSLPPKGCPTAATRGSKARWSSAIACREVAQKAACLFMYLFEPVQSLRNSEAVRPTFD